MKQGSKKKNSKKRKKTQITKKNTKKKVTKKSTGKKNTNSKKNTSVKNNITEKKKVASVKPNEKNKKKEEVIEKSKVLSKKISDKTRKVLILISIFCLILSILLMIPYGMTNYMSEASGKILDVPKFSKLSEECCMYSATFTSVRSYTSLKSELEKIMAKYEKLKCDGKEYFYNKEADYTVTEYGVKRGVIFNKFYITYGNGNSCEIDTSLKNIELLPDDYSISDAKKDGNYVIEGDKVYNASSYDTFLDNVDKKIPSTLRIATTTKEGDLVLTDLKYLADGKFKVIYDGTRDRLNEEDDRVMIAYVYEHIGIYKEKLYAYNGKKITKSMLKTDDVYYLFDIKE